MKKLAVEKGESGFGYYVYFPNDYDKNKQYPMIVFLHGAGERGNGKDELALLENHGFPRYFKEKMMEVNAIVLAPQCQSGLVWNQQVFALKDFIVEMIKKYNADSDRVSLTGMSMGGFGTWEMAITYPELFSGIVPICGGGMAWRTDALKGMPVWAFHGDKDPAVNISNSEEMVACVRKHTPANFTVFKGVAHNSWDPAYLETKVIKWLLAQNRKKRITTMQ